MVYAAVASIARDDGFPLVPVCEALGVCRSAYYAWRDGPPSARGAEATRLAAQIAAIFWRHKRRYGARRIAAELADRGVVCSARRVAKVLKSQGLRAIQPKSFVPRTTDSTRVARTGPCCGGRAWCRA